jgi:hypothetical protein
VNYARATIGLGFLLCVMPYWSVDRAFAGQITPTQQADPLPQATSDTCVQAPRLIPFDRFNSDLSPAVEAALDRIVAQWRSIGGYVLLNGRAEAVELQKADLQHLDAARVGRVEDALTRRGVPVRYVWSRLSKQPNYTNPDESPEDRLLSLYLTAAPAHCLAQVQRLRMDWVLRHCIRVDAPDSATRDVCARALEDKDYNQGE